MNIYKMNSYFEVIQTILLENKTTYGYKAKLAETIGIQRSYLSAFLQKKVHFTLEQIEKLSRFLRLSEAELEFLIDLYNRDRAGTTQLKAYYEKKINRVKNESKDFSNRFKQDSLDEAKQELYYSHWAYSAIHMMITIPNFQDVKSISQRLGLAQTVVLQILTDLEKLNLAQKNGPRWVATQNSLHLSKDSIYNTSNHNQWRQRAVANTLNKSSNANSIHYTALYSLSLQDVNVLRELILDYIDKTRKIVYSSNEEEVVCFNCDLFMI